MESALLLGGICDGRPIASQTVRRMKKDKNSHWTFIQLMALLVLFVATGCNSDDPSEPIILTINPSDIIASNPDWRVDAFNNDGQDNTANFNNYSFEIFSNGDFLINLNGINDSFGGWSISSDARVLSISISNPKPATSGIIGDWNVTAKGAGTLTLEAADGSNTSFRLSK